LTHYVALFSDITARKATESRMRHLALHDALTDLPNRALLSERLQQAILRAKRDRSRVGLMYFDLDKFKPINDSYGHEVGDLLLKAVVKRTTDCVRASDTVARIGGDEFAVLLATVDGWQDALGVAEKIRAALNQAFNVADHVLEISASIGLAIFPENGSDEMVLARHADAALYFAKKKGRNQVYQSDMQGDGDTTDAMPLGKI
jgi:diguanylate cyclase (GGDEF)-like protein